MRTDIDPPSSQCVGTTKAGVRCRQHAVVGTTVCRLHGGNAPQVRRRAEERVKEARHAIYEAVPAAVAALEDVIRNGHNEAARIRAAESVLGYAGIVTKTYAEVNVTGSLGGEVDRELESLAAELVARALPAADAGPADAPALAGADDGSEEPADPGG